MSSNSMPGGFVPSTYTGYTDGAGGGSVSQQAARLSREKNRLTLRSYLHTLLSTSTFASSPVLKSFLLSGPTRLTEEEMADARRREEADRMREDGRMRFAKEITARVDGLRDTVRSVKGELLGKGTHMRRGPRAYTTSSGFIVTQTDSRTYSPRSRRRRTCGTCRRATRRSWNGHEYRMSICGYYSSLFLTS